MKIVSNGKTLEVSSGVSQDIYSLEEQVVGRWIDGKPLYQKSIRFNPIIRANMFCAQAGTYVENTEYLSVKEVYFNDTRGIYVYLPYVDSAGVNGDTISSLLSYLYTRDNNAIGAGNGLLIFANPGGKTFSPIADSGVMTIQYTKTTDQATIELPAGLTVSQPAYIAAPQSAASAELRAETKHEEV